MSNKDNFQTKLPAGLVRVKASANGYHAVERQVQLDGNATVTLKLYPRRAIQESALPSSLYEVPRWRPAPSWQPQPSLIIGLGGTGRQVLTHLKKNLLDAGAGKINEKVRLTLLDTSDYELLDGQQVPVSFAGVSLEKEDIVELGEDLSELNEQIRLHPEFDPDLASWFPAEDYSKRIGSDELNLANGTRQRRPLSRAMLVQDIKKGIPNTGVDIVLLIDRSESMGAPFSKEQPEISKLKAAQDAAGLFISQMDSAVDRVAVVSFHEEPEVLTPLSNLFAVATESIQSLEAGGQTNVHSALSSAEDIFGEVADRARVVILLSDGEGDIELALKQAGQVKSKNIRVVSIGIGDANENLLKGVSSTWNGSPDYFYAADAESLKTIYVRLARRMGEGSRIWRLLHAAASAALDGSALRVIIVGSLAGGFGSAVIADLAYLAKQAGWSLGAKSVSIEAYLATDGVFNRVTSRQDVLQANTFATLREIERFQLAQGFPFRMVYSNENPGDKVLFGKIHWRLLDEIYLFDHLPNISPRNESQKAGWYQPELSVFPSMADAIAFSLDKAAQAGALTQYRRSIQGDVTAEQWARGRAVVGSMGVYRYHLPVRDVFDLLKAQWAVSLLKVFLTGNTNSGLKLDASQNKEETEKDIERHVRLFLLGYAGYETPPCPSALAQVGQIIAEGRSALDAIKSSSITNVSEESRLYEKYLNAAITVMLNGLKTSPVRVARTGKAGYVLQFLNLLVEFLKDAEAIFSSSPSYENLVKQYIQVTLQSEKALKAALLNLSKVYGGVEDAKDGLIELAEKLQQKSSETLLEQDTILTRESILSEPEIASWYQIYFSDPVYMDDAFSRLQWIQKEKGFSLSLKAWDTFTLSDEVEKKAFLGELITLAAYAGRNLLEKETLAVWLQKRLAEQGQIDQVAMQALQCSKPLLSFSEQMASQAKSSLTMGVNAASDSQRLESAVRQSLVAERKLIPLETTDPYALTIMQTMDVIPLDAVDSVRDAKQVYSRWYGLLPGSSPDPRAEPTAVFRAEKIAIVLERRLQKELRQASRIFTPVILTALDAGLPARLYALAFASGWVRHEGNKILLSAPEIQTIEVDIPEEGNLSREFSPYVLGLSNFATQVTPEQVKEIQTALAKVDINLWRRWTTGDWRAHELAALILSTRTPDAEDFASIVALVVREELLKRMKNV